MNITLINPPSMLIENDRIEQNLGIAYIASLLIQEGYDVSICELTGRKDLDFSNILNSIPESDIYGITCFSTTYKSVKSIVHYLRNKNPYAYIALGGPHPTAMPEETLKDIECDSVVVGEGELAFLEIVEKYNSGIHVKGIVNEINNTDIDNYPIPARYLVDQSTYSRRFCNKKVISMITSRGCKYNCLHCNSIIMGGGSQEVRFRSVKSIMNEIQYLKKNGYDTFRFNDDNFAYNPNLKELLMEMKKENIKFRIFSRIEHLTEENTFLLKEAGCSFIGVGLESLNIDNLKFLRKGNMIKHIDNLKIAHNYNIVIRASFMIGLPFDTEENIIRDFSEASNLDFDEFAIYPLIPYPGTEIWKNPEKYGYRILNKDFNDYLQMGINRRTVFALMHTNPVTGYTFYPEDVIRWYEISTNLLSKNKIHMSESQIAT